MKVEDSGHGIGEEKERQIRRALEEFDFSEIARPEVREMGKNRE